MNLIKIKKEILREVLSKETKPLNEQEKQMKWAKDYYQKERLCLECLDKFIEKIQRGGKR